LIHLGCAFSLRFNSATDSCLLLKINENAYKKGESKRKNQVSRPREEQKGVITTRKDAAIQERATD
jgi:hypothetical protein